MFSLTVYEEQVISSSAYYWLNVSHYGTSLKTSTESHLALSAVFHWKEGPAGPCWSKYHHTGPVQTVETDE